MKAATPMADLDAAKDVDVTSRVNPMVDTEPAPSPTGPRRRLARATPTPRYNAGRIAGGVFAAVLVVAAACIAGFFIGRDSVDSTPAAESDEALTQATGQRLAAAAVSLPAGQQLAVTPDLLTGTPANPLEAQLAKQNSAATSALFQSTLGTAALTVTTPVVTTTTHPTTGKPEVRVTGMGTLSGAPMRLHARVAHHDGKALVAVEYYPTAAVSLHGVAGVSTDTEFPSLNAANTVFVLSSDAGVHTFADAAAPRKTANVEAGLNVVSTMSPSDNPGLHTLLATTAPTAASRRRLSAGAGSRTAPIPAHKVTDLAADVDQWFNGMEADVEGLLKPVARFATKNVPGVQFNKNMNLHNVSVIAPAHDGRFNFTANSTLTLTGCAPIVVQMSGYITNTTYKLTGTLDRMAIGSASKGLYAEDVTFTVTGGRGPAIPNASVTYHASVAGTLGFSGVKAAFSTDLPLADGTVAINVSDVHLGKNVVLEDVQLSLSEDDVVAAARVSVKTHLSDAQPLDFDAAFTFDQGVYFVSASISNWHLPLGADGVDLENLSLMMSGPASRAPGISDVAMPEYTLEVSATAAIGDYTFDAQLNLPNVEMDDGLEAPPAASLTPSNVTQGVTFELTVTNSKEVTLQSSMDATIGSGTPLSALPEAQAALDSMKDVAFQSATIGITTSPLSFMVQGTLDVFKMNQLEVHFVAQRVKCSWEFGIGVAIDEGFKFSSIVPSQTGLDYLPFASGMVVVSTSNATFSMATGGAEATTLSVTEGIALSAQLPFKQLSERLVSKGEWSHVESATVTGSFGLSTHDIKLSATLPPNLPLTKDFTLTTGSVSLATTEPHFTIDAEAQLHYSSKQPALDCGLTGSLGDTAYSLTASVDNWHIGAESKGITISSASVELNGKKDTTSGNWTVTGEVKGDVDFDGVKMEAIIMLPVTKDHVDVEIPTLRLNKDVTLSDIDVTVSESNGVKTYSLAGKANVTFSATDNLLFDASATITGSDIHVTGSIPSWNIGGAKGVKCTDVDFDVSGTYTAGAMNDLKGKLSGTADFFGVSVSFEVTLPLNANGDLKLTVSHIDFGSHVELKTVTLTIADTEPKYSLAAQAVIGTGLGHNSQAADDLDLSVTGTMNPETESFTVEGTMSNWGISNDFSIKDLVVNVTGTRKSSGSGTDLDGWLKGSMTFDSVTVDVEAALPADSLTVSFPTMRLTHDVVLKDVSMTITGSSDPSFTFTGSAEITTHLPSSPMTVSASGSISGSTFDLTGSLSSLTIEVGHKGFTLSDLTVSIKDTVGSSDFSGSLAGTMDFDGAELDVKADLPGSTDGGLSLELTLKTGQSMTISKAVTATCGSSSLSSVKAPSSTMSDVKDKVISDLVMKIITKPASYSLTGTVDVFGANKLALDLIAKEASSKWSFGFAVSLAHSFTVADIVSGSDAFTHLPMVGGGVAIANFADYQFKLTGDLGSIATTDGVAFMAAVPLGHLSEKIAAASKWGSSGDATVNGTFTFNTDELTLEGQLPPNLPLDDHVKLNATVILSQSEPKYTLDAAAEITWKNDVDPVVASVDVTVNKDGHFVITGTAEKYSFKVGKHDLVAKQDSTTIELSDGGGSKFSGSLAGILSFKHPDVDMGFNFTIPAPSSADGKGFSFELSVLNGQSVSYGDMLNNLVDEVPVKLPHAFSDAFSAKLLSADIWITTAPEWKFKAAGTMSLFHFDRPLAVELGVQEDETGHWSFGVGIEIGQNFDIGQVLTKASSKANKFHFGSGGVVLTNSKAGWTFTPTTEGMEPISMTDGIAIQGTMDLSQGHLSSVKKMSGVNALTMKASFEFDDHDFRIEADLDADWHIGKKLAVTKAFLFMDIGGPNGFDVGVGCDMAATVGSGKHEQTLDFSSELMISLSGLTFDATMSTPWKEPFNLKGVTIEQTEIMLGISFAGAPDAFGFSGGLQIGKEKGSATVYVDAATPAKLVLGGRLNYFSLGGMLESLTDNLIPSFLTKTIFDVSLTDLSIEFNAGTETLHFDGKSFPVGFRFSVKQFDMFGIKGSFSCTIAPRTFSLKASVDPISVGHDGDLFAISGYDCKTCPATMNIGLGAGNMPGHMFISGQASLLSLVKLDASVNISDAGIAAYIMYTDGIFEVQFQLKAPGLKHPSDFSLYASIQQKLLDWIGTTVVNKLKDAKESADKKLDEAKDKLTEWDDKKKPELDSNKKKIDELKKEEEDKFTDAENKLKDEKSKLNDAENKVNGLQNEINKYDGEKKHCKHWYDVSCKAHNGWLDTKIAALWVAKHAADAALDVAKGAVDAAEKTVDGASKVVANLKPEVVKLEAEDTAIEVAYKAAEAGIDAAKGLTNAALDAIDFAAKAVSEILNIEEIWISAGSLAKVKDGAQLDIGIKGVILGDHFDWQLTIDFPPKLDDIVKNTWDKVKDHIHL